MSAAMRWVWVRRAFHPHKQGALIEVPAQRAEWLISHGFAEGASKRTRRQSARAPEAIKDVSDGRTEAPPVTDERSASR